jgi:hypothetical protein
VTGGYGSSALRSKLTVGQDGRVWIFGPERIYRLDDPREHQTGDGTPASVGAQVEVGPDELVWARDGSSPRSFDGTSWAVRLDLVGAFDVASDGRVWVYRRGAFERLGPDGSELVARGEPSAASWRVRGS